MLIKFDVTQKDIDKAGKYYDNYNCLGCVVLKRVLSIDQMWMGGYIFKIKDSSQEIPLSNKLADYLHETNSGQPKPKKHQIDIPTKLLEQIGYFEQKSELYPESLITTKDTQQHVIKRSYEKV